MSELFLEVTARAGAGAGWGEGAVGRAEEDLAAPTGGVAVLAGPGDGWEVPFTVVLALNPSLAEASPELQAHTSPLLAPGQQMEAWLRDNDYDITVYLVLPVGFDYPYRQSGSAGRAG
jgi:hypothetical protein